MNNFNTKIEQKLVIYSTNGKIVYVLSLGTKSSRFSNSLKHLSAGMCIISNSASNFKEKFVLTE
jgi:hypothetical protein